MQNEIIFLPAAQAQQILEEAIKRGLEEFEAKRKRIENVKLLTINQVAVRLHKSHSTIRKLCENGTIRTTASGLIEENAIEEYLDGRK